MAGNNLFGGLNSGDSSKYKKAGEQAAKRERAEQLDARIDKLLAKKQDIEWAKEALSFVEEETKLNSDIFDLSLNASRLKEIEEKANYIIDRKRQEDEAALKKRVEELDERIAELNKEPRSVAWAERALVTLEKEEKQNADIIKSIKNYAKIKTIKAEAEKIIEKDIAEKEAARKAEEAEKRRIAAEKKAEEERQAAAKRAEEERIAREKEEKRILESAADIDKLIFDLSRAQKSVYWCEDVKNAQIVVDRLETKVRARCKNLAILDELSNIAKKIIDANAIDRKILALVDDCVRDKKNYPSVLDFEKYVTDSLRPYLKEAAKFDALVKEAKDYIKAEEDRAAELRRQAAAKRAEEEMLKREAKKYEEKLEVFIEECKKDNSKYHAADDFVKSIPQPVVMYMSLALLLDLQKAAKEFLDKERELIGQAKAIDKEIEKVVALYKKDKKENAAALVECYKKAMNVSIKEYVDSKLLSEIDSLYAEAVKTIGKQREKQRKQEQAKKHKEDKKTERKRKRDFNKLIGRHPVRKAVIIILEVLLVVAAVAVSFFIPKYRGYSAVSALVLVCLYFAVPCTGIFGGTQRKKTLFTTFNALFAVAAVVAVWYFFNSWLVTAIFAAILFESVVMIIKSRTARHPSTKQTIVFSVIAAVDCIVYVMFMLNDKFPEASRCIFYSLIAVLYVVMWCVIEEADKYAVYFNSSLVASFNTVNAIVMIASVVLTAIGGAFAVPGIACAFAAFATYIVQVVFHKDDNVGFVGFFLLGVSVVVAAFETGLTFFPYGWTQGMVIGFPCIAAFIPFFVVVCKKKFDYILDYSGFACFAFAVMALPLSVFAIIGSVNFPGYMVFLNCASLFNSLLGIIGLFVVAEELDEEGVAYGIAVLSIVLFLVAAPVSIVQIVNHVKAYEETARMISAVRSIIIMKYNFLFR